MTHFVLHILKLNLIAGFIILLVKLLSGSLKSRFTAQWKYFVWFMISLILLVPVPCSGDFALFHIKTPVHTETLKTFRMYPTYPRRRILFSHGNAVGSFHPPFTQSQPAERNFLWLLSVFLTYWVRI